MCLLHKGGDIRSQVPISVFVLTVFPRVLAGWSIHLLAIAPDFHVRMAPVHHFECARREDRDGAHPRVRRRVMDARIVRLHRRHGTEGQAVLRARPPGTARKAAGKVSRHALFKQYGRSPLMAKTSVHHVLTNQMCCSSSCSGFWVPTANRCCASTVLTGQTSGCGGARSSGLCFCVLPAH